MCQPYIESATALSDNYKILQSLNLACTLVACSIFQYSVGQAWHLVII